MKFIYKILSSALVTVSLISCKGANVTPEQLHLASVFSSDVNTLLRAVDEVCQEKAVCPTEYSSQSIVSENFRSTADLLEIKNKLLKCDFSFSQDSAKEGTVESELSTKNCGLKFLKANKSLKKKDGSLETTVSTSFVIRDGFLLDLVSILEFHSTGRIDFQEAGASNKSQILSQFSAVLSENLGNLNSVAGQYEVDGSKEKMEYSSTMHLQLHFFADGAKGFGSSNNEFKLDGKGHDLQNLETRKTTAGDYSINDVSVDWSTFAQTFGVERH